MEQVNAIDMSKARKGYVWDEYKKPREPRMGMIIFTHENGSCNIINNLGQAIHYRNYELIEEPKAPVMRQATIDEIVEQIIRRKDEKGFGWGYSIEEDSASSMPEFYLCAINTKGSYEGKYFWFILADGQKLADVTRNRFEVEVM